MGSSHRHLNYYKYKFLLISTGTEVWGVGFYLVCLVVGFFPFFDKALSLSLTRICAKCNLR